MPWIKKLPVAAAVGLLLVAASQLNYIVYGRREGWILTLAVLVVVFASLIYHVRYEVKRGIEASRKSVNLGQDSGRKMRTSRNTKSSVLVWNRWRRQSQTVDMEILSALQQQITHACSAWLKVELPKDVLPQSVAGKDILTLNNLADEFPILWNTSSDFNTPLLIIGTQEHVLETAKLDALYSAIPFGSNEGNVLSSLEQLISSQGGPALLVVKQNDGMNVIVMCSPQFGHMFQKLVSILEPFYNWTE